MKLWETPIPSSAFQQGVVLIQHPKRRLSLNFEYENSEYQLTKGQLVFYDVIAYRVIYLYGLTGEIINSAYDKLIDLGDTDWLKEIKKASNHKFKEKGLDGNIKHYRICFDDGPCYEFICVSFEVVTSH